MTTIRLFLLLFCVFIKPISGSNSAGSIGQACLLDEEKECLLDNSQCIEGICMCSSFYKYINGSCVTEQSKTLGKECRGGADCRGQGEFCSSFSRCMCLSTHVDVGSQCKPVIYPGQFGCEDSLQCNKGFPGAECDVSRICVCPHGMFVNQQTCVSSDHASSRNTIINELMLQNIIMADHRQINKSEVKGNYFRRRNHDNSNYQLSPDSPCTYDSQCSGYPLANCNNVCQCTRGTLNTGTTCIASSAALQSSVSCPAGQTYVKEAGVCMTVQQPGEPCQYSQQCSALETGAFCLKMRCECVYGMRMSSNGCTLVNKDCKERGHIFISELGECRQVIPPGQKGCSHNSQCSAAYPDATCFMQTCMCPPNLPVAADGTCGRKCGDGYVYSGVTGECLPEVAPGGTCLYSSQCQSTYGGMVCDQNTCRCPNGLIFDGSKCSTTCPAHRRFSENNACVEACSAGKIDVNGECLKKVSIGQACTASAQCTSGSFCQKGNCLCAPGFYVINDQCQAIEAEPNASCMNNEKCTKGSVCFNGRCSCPRNHELVNGYCQANRAVPIGSSCVRIGVTCDGGSVCVAGICVCPLGRTPRNGFCIKHTTALPGTSCADGEECIENSNCNEESMKCECISQTQMVVGNRCVERLRSHPGYGCTFGEMCVGNSMCINGKCECANGKVEINKVCVDQTNARIGEPCGKGIICQGGSYCNTENGKCGCPKGQREINGECKQVVLAYPGESCTEMTSRCAGGSYCVRGRCECPFSMTLVDKKCVVQQTADPGEGCNENTSCSGFSVCKDNKCTCVNEMVVRDNVCVQRRKVNIGASCDKYDQCLGNSNCVEKHCQCAVGHVVSGNVCAPRKTVTPGYLCNPEDICTGQSVCIKGVCQCKPNYKQMHNICVKNTLGLEGNMCSTREDCSETLICDNGICSCSKGMFSVNSKCRSYISLGQTCTTDDKCASTDAICFENTCTCKPGLTIINGECQVPTTPSPPEPTTSEPEVLAQMKAGHIGHFCTYDNQCVVLNSHCARNVCMCKDGFRIFGSTQCIPRVAKAKSKPNKSSRLVNLGETCGKLEICQKGAVCVEETCKCPETFVENNGVCVKPNNATIRVIVPPLSSCLNGEICSGNSECVHGLCFCKEDYTLFHGKCQLLKKVETLRKVESETKRMLLTTPSTTSTSTSTTTTTMTKVTPIPATTTKPTTTTITTTTTQKSTTYPNPIRISMKLLPESMSTTPSTSTTTFKSPWFKLVNHGNPCDSTSFCTNCSVCISGFCACPEGLELLGERCVSHYDAQQCVASNQCPSGANCVRGECKCKPGLGLSRLGFCIPINYADPGTSCAHGERCRGESQCIDGFCVCNNPLLLKGNQCVRSPRDPAPPVRRPAGLTECPADGSCKLPDCFCTPSGKVPPNNMEIKKVPQMVVLTFDDPITDRIINTLKSLFSGRIRNPNGCAIKGTFYISHQWNNYDQSQWLYSKGNEIGVNSITREDLSERTKERWLREQKGMRDTLSEFSYIEKSQIIGTRAPSYRVGGDLQFEMLAENNFTFDNSMLVNGLYWPQTLEHKLSWECDGKCPQRSHKNVWEIPIQKIQANDGNWYPTLVRALKPSDSRVSVKQILMRNFLNNYKSNRAPFVLTLSTDFLTYLPDNGAISALEDFLKEVVQKNDVYITTGGQVIDWMRKPTPVDSLKSLRSWQCSFLMNDQVQPCESPSTCTFNSRSRGQPAHSFRICGSCPRNSPWVQ